jgi:hypothetical protein
MAHNEEHQSLADLLANILAGTSGGSTEGPTPVPVQKLPTIMEVSPTVAATQWSPEYRLPGTSAGPQPYRPFEPLSIGESVPSVDNSFAAFLKDITGIFSPYEPSQERLFQPDLEVLPLLSSFGARDLPVDGPVPLPAGVDDKPLTSVSDKFVFPEIDETNPLEIDQRIGELEVAIKRAMEDEDNPDWNAVFGYQGEIRRLTRKLTGQDRIRAEKRADKLATALADAQVAAATAAAEARTAAATAAAEARTTAATVAAEARTTAATALADAQRTLVDAQNEWQAGQSEAALASQRALAEAQRAHQVAMAKQAQQFGLLSTLLPLFLQQQQQQSQFAQTQGLAQQRFAQEQVETRRFETERQEELDRDLNQRKQAASLIPQLFPNMEIDEAILAGGIDPSLIPVLISLARLRAEQDVAGQRPTRQPIVTFAR